jgi:hypothetical protein
VLLAERFPLDFIRQSLVPPGTWTPYPRITDRDTWTGLPDQRQRELVADGESLLRTSWPELKATLFMEYQRDGNRTRYQEASYERRKMLIRLVAAECVENQGRFVDDIINGIWAICEESFWDVPAHNRYVTSSNFGRGGALPDVTRPVVALFSAETGTIIGYTDYLVREALDKVDPIVSNRTRHEIRTRLLDPFMEHDNWWWLGFVADDGHKGPPNNWNPWILSNLLTLAMLAEEEEERRAALIHRALRGLDKFLDGYHSDGGCDEGISYWGRAGASVFECLDVLESASNGAIAVWDDRLIQEMARYVYRTHIGGNWYVNFADGSAKTVPDPNIVYHFGQKIGDAALMAHGVASGAETTSERPGFISFNRFLNTLFRPIPKPETGSDYPLILQSWLDGIEVLTARETEGTDHGLFLAAKGGHNGESHNHNDIGSFIVGLDGQPVLIDVGVGEYTRKTFSSERYDIWTMQSAYHNLPTIDGQHQSPGHEYRASDVRAETTPDYAELRLDIAGAWADEVGLERWDRTVRLKRGSDAAVIVEDAWTMRQAPESLVLTLMAAGAVDSSTPGLLRLAGPERDLLVEYDAATWQVTTERVEINDTRLAPVWGDFISRVLLTYTNPAATGNWSLRVHA